MMKYIFTNIFVSRLLVIKYGSLPVRVLMWVWMWVFPQCTLVIMLSPCSSPWMKEEPVDNKSINVRWLLIVHIINKTKCEFTSLLDHSDHMMYWILFGKGKFTRWDERIHFESICSFACPWSWSMTNGHGVHIWHIWHYCHLSVEQSKI